MSFAEGKDESCRRFEGGLATDVNVRVQRGVESPHAKERLGRKVVVMAQELRRVIRKQLKTMRVSQGGQVRWHGYVQLDLRLGRRGPPTSPWRRRRT